MIARSLFFFLAILISYGAHAQLELKIRTLNMIIGNIGLSAEAFPTTKMGIEFEAIYTRNRTISTFQSEGAHVTGMWKWYVKSRMGHDGIFLAAFTRIQDDPDFIFIEPIQGPASTVDFIQISPGLGAGFKWMSRKGVVFEYLVGLAVPFQVPTGRQRLSSVPLIRVSPDAVLLPYARLSIGYRFRYKKM